MTKNQILVTHGKVTHPIGERCDVCDEAKREWKIVEELIIHDREELIKKIEKKKKKIESDEMPTLENYHSMTAYNQAIEDVINLIKNV